MTRSNDSLTLQMLSKMKEYQKVKVLPRISLLQNSNGTLADPVLVSSCSASCLTFLPFLYTVES